MIKQIKSRIVFDQTYLSCNQNYFFFKMQLIKNFGSCGKTNDLAPLSLSNNLHKSVVLNCLFGAI